MVKKVEWKPELLDEHHFRIKVFGGWMVTVSKENNKSIAFSSIFVPDRDHEWYPYKPEEVKEVPREIPEMLK